MIYWLAVINIDTLFVPSFSYNFLILECALRKEYVIDCIDCIDGIDVAGSIIA